MIRGMPLLPDQIPIGVLAARSGVSTSALRFYESRGLIRASRNSGNQRRYPRYTLRRVAFIRAAQRVGLSLDEIQAALAGLPTDKAPAKADWARLSQGWRPRLDARIKEMEKLRDELTGCIGCGCLSLRTCRLINRDDVAAVDGAGSYLLVDRDAVETKADRSIDAARTTRRVGREG
jgi:MerR family transcriptional regulator, redox-sensitive transcriptional activator SoxR